MKYKIIILSIVFAMSFLQFCHAQEKVFNEGYKNAKWGMAKEQVKSSFPDMMFKDEGKMTYFLSKIAEEDVMIGFDFVDNKLYLVVIGFQISTMNKDVYISKFNKFEELLIKKYGDPDQRVRRGSTNRYTSDADAISMGEGVYFDTWKTPESEVSLLLTGDNFELNLGIRYQSIELGKEKEKLDKEKSLDNL